MAQYPSAAGSDSNLWIAKNNLVTLLSGAHDASVTTITVSSAASFPSTGYITIDSEAIKYTGKTATTFTGCTRGADGTAAASHTDLTNVLHTVIADHHNVLKDEIIAVEGDLVGVLAAITPVTAASTASSVLQRFAHIVSQLKNGLGLTNWYDATTFRGAPAGGMMDFGGTSAPTGWLLCDGSAVSRSTYADLFTAIGTTWGTGDGSTTFNVPDFRRRTAVGSGGSGTGVLGNAVGNTGGTETHTLVSGEMPSHTHTQDAHGHTASDSGHTHGVQVVTNNGVNGSNPFGVSSTTNNGTKTSFSGSAVITVANATATNQSTGGGGAHNNMQPSAVVLKIIKT